MLQYIYVGSQRKTIAMTPYNLILQEIIYEVSVQDRFYIQQTRVDFTHTCIHLLNCSTGNYSRKGK